ncbi:glycosyltransferase [Paenarthrobacter nicotinovorans]|uniref:glycosyltransferase family protein n=1 Tax=Paenarthrobacter nicotinovorans TaxID=29320 RepID=UPI0038207B42
MESKGADVPGTDGFSHHGVLPKMVLFRRTSPRLAPFLKEHLEDQVRVLSRSFEVKVINRDCDYGQVCDEHEPAISVFETGVYSYGQRITNTHLNPDIPKLGFLHADAYDISRAVFLSNMAEWGVEDFFTTSTAMAEYSPEIAKRLFVWPNAVNPETFKDYDLSKNIPVLLTGSQERHYPWRNAVGRVLSEKFPTMAMPHFGWGSGTERLVTGTAYAQLLNASYFVPACGSMARDVVRKQLEIPAAGACLVTEWSPRLEEFGFVDMVNCVFADSSNAVDKVGALLKDREHLDRITSAGHDLVHSRHTAAHRNQVREWLELYRSRKPGQVIAQETVCSSLILVPQGEPGRPIAIGPGLDRLQLAKGWSLLRGKDVLGAEHEFLKCLNFYFIPEAVTGMVFTSLLKGDPSAALDWITQALTRTFREGGGSDPDPVLWACRIRALVCAGETVAARRSAGMFPHMGHYELDRVRQAVWHMDPASAGTSSKTQPALSQRRPSIAPVPELDLPDWTREFKEMITRCRSAAMTRPDSIGTSPGARGPGTSQRPLWEQALAATSRSVKSRLSSGAVLKVRMRLSPLKQRFVATDWSRLIRETARREQLTRALLIGEADPKDSRALEAGLALNAGRPPLDVSASLDQASAQRMLPREPAERVLVLLNYQSEHMGRHDAAHLKLLSLCALIMIRGTTTTNGVHLLSALVDSGDFVVLAHDGSKGTAVLRRFALAPLGMVAPHPDS